MDRVIKDFIKPRFKRTKLQINESITLPKKPTITEEAEEIYKKIKNLSEKNQGLVLYSQLLDRKDRKEVAYKLQPLLYLANKNKIELYQEGFFNEILIKIGE